VAFKKAETLFGDFQTAVADALSGGARAALMDRTVSGGKRFDLMPRG
jgi:hypothetical protein